MTIATLLVLEIDVGVHTPTGSFHPFQGAIDVLLVFGVDIALKNIDFFAAVVPTPTLVERFP